MVQKIMSNKKTIPPEIKKEEMIGALKRSGYLIEQRIYPILQRLDYYFETNPIYEDPEQHKAREIDFKAIRILKNKEVEIQYILFGECVNNPYPIIFFSSKVMADLAYQELSLTFSGLPIVYPNENNSSTPFKLNDGRIPLSVLLKLRSSHHYFDEFPSTQYCSFQYKTKLEEWMAFHDDSHHEDFKKLVDSIIFERNIITKNIDIALLKNIVFYYPLIVLAGDLIECNQYKKSIPKLKKVNHIKFKKSCISKYGEEKFIIDVIKESYLENYLKMIHEEHSKILDEITKNIDLIKRTINSTRTKFGSFHDSDIGKSKI